LLAHRDIDQKRRNIDWHTPLDIARLPDQVNQAEIIALLQQK